MVNPSAAIMSIHAASEALSQGHDVTYFAFYFLFKFLLLKKLINI